MKIWISVFAACLFSLESVAQMTSPFNKESALGSRQGYEYFVGRDLGRPLITVDLLSGVREPGVYHVPVNTQISELISYAGGALETADLEEVRIRRSQGPSAEVKLVNYNLIQSFREVSPLLIVQDRDAIHIPMRTNLDNTLKWSTLIATLLSVVTSAVLISEYQQRK